MRRPSLVALLVALNAGLVFLALAIIVWEASGLLRAIADEKGIAQAESAARSASQAAAERLEAAYAAAELAADPSTIARIEAGDAGLQEVLDESFRKGIGGRAHDVLPRERSLAVLRDARITAHVGAPLPPGAAVARAGEWTGGTYLGRDETNGHLVAAAWAEVRGQPGVKVMASHAIDDVLGVTHVAPDARAIFVPSDSGLSGDEERDELRGRALSSGEPTFARSTGRGSYLAVLPLKVPGRIHWAAPDMRVELVDVGGLIEVEVPAEPIDAVFRSRIRILVALSLVVAALVAAASFAIARAIAGPLGTLTESASRIGRGDFATSVAPARGAEMGALAEAMESMRVRLQRSHAELRRRHAGAEAVLAGVVEGVFAVDRERRIRYLNPQTAAMLGLTVDEAEAAIGRFCGDVLRPRDADGGRPCEDRCPIVHARFLGSARATETLHVSGEARRVVVITSAAPASTEEGAGPEREQQFQVMRDETELEATRRLRDTILANISHEFRTPLAAQLASIELLRDRLADLTVDETRTLLLALERGTMRLTQLIDNLLESVRIESGRLTIRRQPVAIDEVIEEAVAMTSHLFAARRQEIVVDLPYPLPSAVGDAPRLTQVFVNLLANANKYAPEGSTIRVGGSVEGSQITVWVEDQGPGLPAGGESEVFRRFYRSPGEEPSESGLGLGLWIVKSIVERHEGRVEARPASGGSGTRMCVVLPREKVHENPGR